MLIEDYLYKSQAALSALGSIARYYANDTSMPPQDFGFGLSVILGYIEDDIRADYNECTKPKEKTE